MKVRYERPSPDLSYTVQAPLFLSIGKGRDILVREWSLDGIRPPAELEGDGGNVIITIPFQGFWITFKAGLERDFETGMMRFSHLGERETQLLRHFYRQIVTGRVVPLENTIASMDAPVDIVPMIETPQETERRRRRVSPRPLRLLAILCLYGLLSVLAYKPVLLPILDETRAYLEPVDVARF
ncbi:hypothetical protein [Tropicimonas sp. IMCC6043]|uniref:hypothetical protein n=1 Tax=Tropicimonas sp. IMCC6043 TaxID=2510645 RepID=UPI00101BC2BB|nr:hypothetical protein [Tropicimonas sp. IMCC6043]RYH09224.1 hypothetical protein EU800_13545 [Tropicimonas sp. IMCC6043]